MDEYPYLKMVCAKKGLSLKEFATNILIEAIQEAEDEMLAERANKRLETMQPGDVIGWSEVKQIWNDGEV